MQLLLGSGWLATRLSVQVAMIVLTSRLQRLIHGDSLRVVAAAEGKEKATAYLRLLLRTRQRYQLRLLHAARLSHDASGMT